MSKALSLKRAEEAEKSRDSWIGMYKIAQERAESAESRLSTLVERAAQVAEEEAGSDDGTEFDRIWGMACRACAASIRELSQESKEE